jgi:hypothetical protein
MSNKIKRLNEFQIKDLWAGIYTSPAGVKYESVEQAVRLLWKTYKKNNPELLTYFKEFTLIESSEIREEILKWIEANPSLKISDFQHQGLLTLESIKVAIESIEKEGDNSYFNSKLHMDLNYWKKIKTKSQGISDLNTRYDYLIDEKQEFMSRNRGSEADIIITWFTDEIERIKLLISSKNDFIVSNANDKTSSFSDSLYDFLHIADAGLHNKDYSCTSYYSNINFYFEKFKSEFQNLFSRIQKDKEINFIDSYINEIKRYSKNFSSCYSLEALEFFNKEKLTFESFGDYTIIITDDDKDRKCKLFHYNFDHLRDMAVDWEYIDLSRSVICYISDHFITKTLDFFENLKINLQISENNKNNYSGFKSDFAIGLNALNKYINEIQTIEIKVVEYNHRKIYNLLNSNIPLDRIPVDAIIRLYDLSHYDQKKSDYKNHITRLQQEVVNEISLLGDEYLTRLLKRLEQIEKRFTDAWKFYYEICESFNAQILTSIDFDIKFSDYFIVPKHNDGVINQEFLFSLHDALIYKQGSLSGMINQTKQLLNIPENDFPSKKQPPPSKPKDLNAFTYVHFGKNFSGLSSLLNYLKDKNFISDKTAISDFRKIFNNTQPDNPIRWLNGIESLSYFIKLLHRDYKLIEPVKDIWKVTSVLFVDENNKVFDSKSFKGQKVPSASKAKLLEDSMDFLN